MLDELPDALKQSLPDRLFTSDPEAAAKAWEELSSPRGLFTLLMQSLSEGWQRWLTLLLRLCGILLLRAILNSGTGLLHTQSLSEGVRLLCRVGLFGLIAGQALESLGQVVAYIQDLQTLSSAFLPLMGAMYAMGGNIGTAVVNHSTLLLSLGLIEWVGGCSVVPLFSLCLAFSLLSAFGGFAAGKIQVVTGKLKKWYTTALALVMLLLNAALGAQTALRAGADSLTFRTVRFAVSSSIPMVGGGIAELLRQAASGVGWLREIVGIGGVLLLCWLLLPCVLSLLLTRLLYGVACDVAAWLGCEEEGKLLGEISGLFGYLLAIVALCSMTFLFASLLLMKCGTAYGG